MAPAFQDDKAPICIPFILEQLQAHQEAHRKAAQLQRPSSSVQPPQDGVAARPLPPLMIGLNGMQGVGKTTLVAALAGALEARGVRTLVCSVDDFYLTHGDQRALAEAHPDNALVQHRGEPGELLTFQSPHIDPLRWLSFSPGFESCSVRS